MPAGSGFAAPGAFQPAARGVTGGQGFQRGAGAPQRGTRDEGGQVAGSAENGAVAAGLFRLNGAALFTLAEVQTQEAMVRASNPAPDQVERALEGYAAAADSVKAVNLARRSNMAGLGGMTARGAADGGTGAPQGGNTVDAARGTARLEANADNPDVAATRATMLAAQESPALSAA